MLLATLVCIELNVLNFDFIFCMHLTFRVELKNFVMNTWLQQSLYIVLQSTTEMDSFLKQATQRGLVRGGVTSSPPPHVAT